MVKMNTEEFLKELEDNKTDFPPDNPNVGAFYMNNEGNIFVFYDNIWQEVEDVSLDVDQKEEDERLRISQSALPASILFEEIGISYLNT